MPQWYLVTLDNTGQPAKSDVPWRVAIPTLAGENVHVSTLAGATVPHWRESATVLWVRTSAPAGGTIELLVAEDASFPDTSDGYAVFDAFADTTDPPVAADLPFTATRHDAGWSDYVVSGGYDRQREMGPVLKLGGTWYTWITVYASANSLKYIQTLTSTNGTSWTAAGTSTFQGEDPYVVYDNGTFHLWFEGKGDAGIPATSIGYTTSADGVTWAAPTEALAQGGVGDFDEFDVSSPVVAQENGLYYLFHEGRDGAGHGRIGVATAASLAGPWMKDPASPVVPLLDTYFDNQQHVPDDLVYLGNRWILLLHGLGDPGDPGGGSGSWTGLAAEAPTLDGPWTVRSPDECLLTEDTYMLEQGRGTLALWATRFGDVGPLRRYLPLGRNPNGSAFSLTLKEGADYDPGATALLLLNPEVSGIGASVAIQAQTTYENSFGLVCRRKMLAGNRRHVMGFGRRKGFEGRAYRTKCRAGYTWWGNAYNDWNWRAYSDTGAETQLGGQYVPADPAEYTELHKHELRYTAAGALEFYLDDVLKSTVNDTTYLSGAKWFLVGQGRLSTNETSVLEWAFVYPLHTYTVSVQLAVVQQRWRGLHHGGRL